MSSRIVVPKIKDFPKDGRKWRLDWLGAISSNLQESSEPTIDVLMSPVKVGVVNPLSAHSIHGEERTVFKVGVGLLPFLRIGSLWKDGRPLAGFAGGARRFDEVVISAETVTQMPASQMDLALGDGYSVIPAWVYEFGGLGLKSRCLAIEQDNDPFAIILPAIEAIRFYYAGSTNLTSLSLFGAYENYLTDIINPEESGYLSEQDRCVLRLRRWITDDDGWTIGRVLHSPLARMGVRKIYESIIPYSVEGQPAYPTCDLPFEGTTRWLARGIPFESVAGEKRFFIFELTRCSSPFPFEQLHVTRDNDGRKALKETDIPEEGKKPCWAIPRVVGLQTEEAELQKSHDPRRAVDPVFLNMIGERFDALVDQEIIKTEKIEAPYMSGQLVSLSTIDVKQLSTGSEIGGNQLVGPMKVQEPTRRKGAKPSFEIMLEATELLDQMEGFSASMRSASYDHFLMPRLKPENRRQWPYLDFGSRTIRCVWAIDIQCRGVHYCFIDYELRRKGEKAAGLVRLLVGEIISFTDFNRILNGISVSEGNWRNSYFLQHDIITTRRKHTWTNGSECAEAVAEMIR